MDIPNSTLLITGGGSGIGRGLAEALHAGGAKVIIAGRRAAALQAIADVHPGMGWALLDVEDAEAIKTFATTIVRDYPSLNGLINNAGVMRREDLLAEPVALEDAETTIATNLLGPIRLTAALLPHLRRQASATIVNVTSGLAFVPLAATPTYCATKAALHSYSQSLRFQLRETPVKVIELAPPAVATDLMPGHADNPRSMPLDAYIAESLALLAAHPDGPEICVQNVQMLRTAEASGRYDQVFGMLNGN